MGSIAYGKGSTRNPRSDILSPETLAPKPNLNPQALDLKPYPPLQNTAEPGSVGSKTGLLTEWRDLQDPALSQGDSRSKSRVIQVLDSLSIESPHMNRITCFSFHLLFQLLGQYP